MNVIIFLFWKQQQQQQQQQKQQFQANVFRRAQPNVHIHGMQGMPIQGMPAMQGIGMQGLPQNQFLPIQPNNSQQQQQILAQQKGIDIKTKLLAWLSLLKCYIG